MRQWTGIPVSVVVASTKTLAKVANERAKQEPDLQGVLDLTGYSESELDKLLSEVEVEEVWGIGPRKAEVLHQQGIRSALDLKYVSDQWLKKHLTITGLLTRQHSELQTSLEAKGLNVLHQRKRKRSSTERAASNSARQHRIVLYEQVHNLKGQNHSILTNGASFKGLFRRIFIITPRYWGDSL